MTKGFLGIDAGTQGLSVVFTDEQLQVLATGDGSYEMVTGLEEGCYEQRPEDWESALSAAMADLRAKLNGQEIDVLGIGVSGQMHGEVLADATGQSVGSARLWCDIRNEAEGAELTERFGVKVPKRMTVARWLWTIRNDPEKAQRAARMTTPSGWLAYRLTGEWVLGVGDASGMFPIDQGTMNYDERFLDSFDELVSEEVTSIRNLLPEVRCAGQDGGRLNQFGAEILGLPEGTPVAPAEGDQPASLAGSLIGEAGMVSASFGTSVCANSVGDRAFKGVSDAVDHFCAPDGKPINMVWLRNGTIFMNTVVEMLGSVAGDRESSFAQLMPLMVEADDDCGGLLALPFMDDEPGLGVQRGGTALMIGLNGNSATPGNAVKAALLATMFNLRLGSELLDEQGYPRTEIILAGGVTKTPEAGQLLANVFNTKVSLLQSAEEGTAWGAALMACFRRQVDQGGSGIWSEFLQEWKSENAVSFEPGSEAVALYEQIYAKYKALLAVQPTLDAAVGG